MMTKKGFTLVELLVAIGIIATLAAILLPNLMGARERARDAQRKQDLDSVKSALRLYYNDHERYPIQYPSYHTNGAEFLNSDLSGYMPNVSGIGFTFEYVTDVNGDTFKLRFETEASNSEDNNASQIKCGVDSTNPRHFMVCAN